jgi:hypothetical protein
MYGDSAVSVTQVLILEFTKFIIILTIHYTTVHFYRPYLVTNRGSVKVGRLTESR